MTVLSHRPHRRSSHADPCTHIGDPEPRIEELLGDPIVHALMARDRVSRPALEKLIAEVRRRLGPDEGPAPARLDSELLRECI